MNCGHKGEEFIFSFTDYSYCVASNEEATEYVDDVPQWVKDKGVGEAEIGEPVGCPKCRIWGVNNFKMIP